MKKKGRRFLARIAKVSAALSFFFVLSLAGSAPRPFGDLLEEADELRSSDPARFQQLIAQLEAEVEHASIAERQRFRYLRAYQFAVAGNFDVSMSDLRSLIAETTDPVIRFRATSLLANNYALTRQFSEALSSLDEALGMLERVPDKTVRHQGLLTAGILYNQVGQYELGRYYSQLLLQDGADPRTRCFAGQLRLEALIGLQEPPPDSEFVSAVKACVAAREGIASNLVRTSLARLLFERGENAEASELLSTNLQDIESTRYALLIAEARSLLAEMDYARGSLASAEQHAQAALATASGSFNRPVVNAHRVLYLVAVKRGDSVAALTHYRDYAEADKGFLNEVKTRELAYQLAKHEALQKAHTIEILNKQNEVLRLQQQVAAQSANNNRLLAVLLGLLVTAIGYWAYRTKRTQMSFRRLAETDALTGIANRRHFMQQAEEALQYAAHANLPVALVLFDLDHFKRVNDTYGHPIGDWVLKRTADACRQACRKNDLIGRLGGEEFGVLLLGCDSAAAVMAAEQCRAAIEAIDTADTGHAFAVSASFGVAPTHARHYELKALMVQADQALYRSKEGGRNRISLYEPGKPDANKTTEVGRGAALDADC